MTASLLVTSAINDSDLFRYLGSMAVRCPIPCGDVNFYGRKDDLSPLSVCVERKRIHDLVNSINDGRYLSQLQAAHEAGFDVFILIYEGAVRPSPIDGMLEVPVWRYIKSPKSGKTVKQRVWEPLTPNSISYSRFTQYITELDYLAGVIVRHSLDVKETAAIIKALWDNFQTPPSKHQSLHKIFTPPPTHVMLHKPSLVRRIAVELDGIGWERSAEVEKKFPTVSAMVNAGVKDWESIDGIGRKTALRVVANLNGGKVK